MDKVAVGKETSQHTDGEKYFQAYQELLRQKKQIDKEIFKLLRSVSKTTFKSLTARAKYIPRLKNTATLANAIRECMVRNEKMTMKDILKSLSKKSLYHTNSSYFYTMVNNKLNRDPRIKKVSRGIFVYKSRGRKKSNAAA